MAKDREKLHDIFEELLESRNVYFSPPDGMQLDYPCIIYKHDLIGGNFADNVRYIKKNRYSITVVDEDPDSNIPNMVMDLPTAYFNTYFAVDNLNHWQMSLYF